MATDKLGNQTVRTVLLVVVGLAALNWGLIEFADFDLITDLVFEPGTTEYSVTIAAVSGAAVVTLYNQFVAFSEGR